MNWTDVVAATASAAAPIWGTLSELDLGSFDSPGWRAVGRGVLLGLGAAMPLGPVNVEIARRVLRAGFFAGVALGLGAVTVDVVYALTSAFSFVRLDDRPRVARTVGAVGVAFLVYLGVQCLRAARAAWKHDPLDDVGGDPLPMAPPTGVTEPARTSRDREGAVLPGEPLPHGRGSHGRTLQGGREDPVPANRLDYARAVPARRATGRSAYVTGLLMTLLNPMTLVFWFTVVPATGGAAAVAAAGFDATPQAGGNDLPMMCAGVFIGTTAWVFAFASLLAAAAAKAGARRPRRRRAWLATADAVGGATLLGFAVAAFLRLVRSLS